MRAWCDHCNQYVAYTREITRTEELVIDGVKFNANQSYGICPVCGEEVLSNAQVDSNVHKAHNAYRRALGSICSEEIKTLLDKYNIGAQPLSLLLGWGANTIERQMKHTIPSNEHARRLRELMNPQAMYTLLENNKERISDVAYKKALKAVFQYLEFDIRRRPESNPLRGSFINMDSASMNSIFALAGSSNQIRMIKYSDEIESLRAQYQLAFSGR